MFGPAMKPRIQQAAIEANTDKEKSWSASDESETARRTIYAFIKRGLVVPMLEVLDLADTVSSCPKRQVTTVAPQALTLFNGEFVNEQARRFAKRLQTEAGSDPQQIIIRAWRLALCRPPTDTELATTVEFFEAELARLASIPAEPDELGKQTAESTAIVAQICRVILNLNEFAYPE
jgi:hypothetical protein